MDSRKEEGILGDESHPVGSSPPQYGGLVDEPPPPS